jgi:hypothetical protein
LFDDFLGEASQFFGLVAILRFLGLDAKPLLESGMKVFSMNGANVVAVR